MYTFICLLMIGSGGGILFFFPYEENPGKAVAAIVLIAFGLFLLLFKNKGAEDVGKAAESMSTNWWHWW